MLTTLTTLTALASLGLPQLPAAVPLPAALAGARIELTLRTTANHFAAENGSTLVQVLLFGVGGCAPRAVRLAPGARVLYPFPRGAFQQFSVEVVALEGESWRNSGAFDLASVRASGALWVQASDDRSTLWVEDGGQGLRHLVPTRGLVPAAWRRLHPELSDFQVASSHVPVPLPTGGKKGGKPPVIEKQKLPPV